MAQADSVPSSSRQLITGERANKSTSLRAVKLPAVSIQPLDRHYFIASSDVRVIVDGVPLLWIWRERRPDIELETSIGQERLDSNIGVLSYETVGFLLRRLLRNILILLRIRSRNKPSYLSAFDGVASNQLVRSKPQGRL